MYKHNTNWNPKKIPQRGINSLGYCQKKNRAKNKHLSISPCHVTIHSVRKNFDCSLQDDQLSRDMDCIPLHIIVKGLKARFICINSVHRFIYSNRVLSINIHQLAWPDSPLWNFETLLPGLLPVDHAVNFFSQFCFMLVHFILINSQVTLIL